MWWEILLKCKETQTCKLFYEKKMREAARKLIAKAKGNKTSTKQFPGRIDDLTISYMRDGK